jgi:hypothetical protein
MTTKQSVKLEKKTVITTTSKYPKRFWISQIALWFFYIYTIIMMIVAKLNTVNYFLIVFGVATIWFIGYVNIVAIKKEKIEKKEIKYYIDEKEVKFNE